MDLLNIKPKIKRVSESHYEIDFVYDNEELQHLPSYGYTEFRVTRGQEDIRDGVVLITSIQRYVDIFGPGILSEMTRNANQMLRGQLYEPGVILGK